MWQDLEMAITKTGGLYRKARKARERGEAIHPITAMSLRPHVPPSFLLMKSAMAGTRAGLGL